MTNGALERADCAPEQPRALDHLVLPVHDLAAAAAAYAAIGFTVGGRNRHPWGTENHIIQFPTAFLELVALAPDFTPLTPGDPAFPFAGFLAGQGMSSRPSGMIVLRSEDAVADAAAFQRQGIGSGRRLDFARTGRAPDGAARTVAFSLAFAENPAVPDLGFFVCRQHHPENFWDPARQQHANGVTGVSALGFEADRPADLGMFLQRFAGVATATSQDGAATVTLADGAVLIARRAAACPGRLCEIVFQGPRPFRHAMGTLQLRCGS